jgi:hypothetical protein
MVMITTYGVRRNDYANELIDHYVQMEDLFS